MLKKLEKLFHFCKSDKKEVADCISQLADYGNEYDKHDELMKEIAASSDNDDHDYNNHDHDYIWAIDGLNYLDTHSFAVIQGNVELKVQSEIFVGGRQWVFVGVYEGHGGSHCSKYVNAVVRANFIENLIAQHEVMDEEVLIQAIIDTEEGFKKHVASFYHVDYNNQIAATGSSCLIGVVWDDMMYIANLGKSRAVLGYEDSPFKIASEQLTMDQGTEVFGCIGDMYLKDPRYAILEEHKYEDYQVVERRSSKLSTITRKLCHRDKFLILASDGFWKYMSPEQAVEFVHREKQGMIAKRLVHKALRRAARQNSIAYETLLNTATATGDRRKYHDDLCVVIVFLDQHGRSQGQPVGVSSVQGNDGYKLYADYDSFKWTNTTTTPSSYNTLKGKGIIKTTPGPLPDPSSSGLRPEDKLKPGEAPDIVADEDFSFNTPSLAAEEEVPTPRLAAAAAEEVPTPRLAAAAAEQRISRAAS